MELDQNSCPFEENLRASRCESCCEQHAVPPCARGWLKAQYSSRAPQPFGFSEWQKKAA